MSDDNFKKLIESLSLTNIQPLKIEFERKGNFPTENSEININWRISYPSESFEEEQNFLKLYPMFVVEFIFDNEIIYSHKSIFSVILTIKNKEIFNSFWEDDSIQKFFKEKQLVKTLWPIVRQQTLDGLSRLSLPPISLPWLF